MRIEDTVNGRGTRDSLRYYTLCVEKKKKNGRARARALYAREGKKGNDACRRNNYF